MQVIQVEGEGLTVRAQGLCLISLAPETTPELAWSIRFPYGAGSEKGIALCCYLSSINKHQWANWQYTGTKQVTDIHTSDTFCLIPQVHVHSCT